MTPHTTQGVDWCHVLAPGWNDLERSSSSEKHSGALHRTGAAPEHSTSCACRFSPSSVPGLCVPHSPAQRSLTPPASLFHLKVLHLGRGGHIACYKLKTGIAELPAMLADVYLAKVHHRRRYPISVHWMAAVWHALPSIFNAGQQFQPVLGLVTCTQDPRSLPESQEVTPQIQSGK